MLWFTYRLSDGLILVWALTLLFAALTVVWAP